MSYKVTDETIKASLRPFDIVVDKIGNVGIIQEVSVNHCQPEAKHQISYSVEWIVGGKNVKNAWYHPGELTFSGCNMLIKIAEMACHPFGNNEESVKRFFQP